MILKKILIGVLSIACTAPANAQGCSDAGFCTMGNLRPGKDTDSLRTTSASLQTSFGVGEQGVITLQATPELNYSFSGPVSLQLKMPFAFASGDLGNTAGWGDLSAVFTVVAMRKDNGVLSFSAGTKIGTGKTDLRTSGKPLPMPYQPGLGTHDIVLGVSFQYSNWIVGAGYQRVLSNQNNNGFTHMAWEGNADAGNYFESAGLDRNDDVLLRLERAVAYRRVTLIPGLLAIYRVGEDRITHFNDPVAVQGSGGLTLNITASANFKLNERASLAFRAGSPIVVRESRPDGLTRSLVVSAAFIYRLQHKSP